MLSEYKFIFDPIKKQNLLLNTTEGRELLDKYCNQQAGGGYVDTEALVPQSAAEAFLFKPKKSDKVWFYESDEPEKVLGYRQNIITREYKLYISKSWTSPLSPHALKSLSNHQYTAAKWNEKLCSGKVDMEASVDASGRRVIANKCSASGTKFIGNPKIGDNVKVGTQAQTPIIGFRDGKIIIKGLGAVPHKYSREKWKEKLCNKSVQLNGYDVSGNHIVDLSNSLAPVPCDRERMQRKRFKLEPKIGEVFLYEDTRYMEIKEIKTTNIGSWPKTQDVAKRAAVGQLILYAISIGRDKTPRQIHSEKFTRNEWKKALCAGKIKFVHSDSDNFGKPDIDKNRQIEILQKSNSDTCKKEQIYRRVLNTQAKKNHRWVTNYIAEFDHAIEQLKKHSDVTLKGLDWMTTQKVKNIILGTSVKDLMQASSGGKIRLLSSGTSISQWETRLEMFIAEFKNISFLDTEKMKWEARIRRNKAVIASRDYKKFIKEFNKRRGAAAAAAVRPKLANRYVYKGGALRGGAGREQPFGKNDHITVAKGHTKEHEILGDFVDLAHNTDATKDTLTEMALIASLIGFFVYSLTVTFQVIHFLWEKHANITDAIWDEAGEIREMEVTMQDIQIGAMYNKLDYWIQNRAKAVSVENEGITRYTSTYEDFGYEGKMYQCINNWINNRFSQNMGIGFINYLPCKSYGSNCGGECIFPEPDDLILNPKRWKYIILGKLRGNLDGGYHGNCARSTNQHGCVSDVLGKELFLGPCNNIPGYTNIKKTGIEKGVNKYTKDRWREIFNKLGIGGELSLRKNYLEDYKYLIENHPTVFEFFNIKNLCPGGKGAGCLHGKEDKNTIDSAALDVGIELALRQGYLTYVDFSGNEYMRYDMDYYKGICNKLNDKNLDSGARLNVINICNTLGSLNLDTNPDVKEQLGGISSKLKKISESTSFSLSYLKKYKNIITEIQETLQNPSLDYKLKILIYLSCYGISLNQIINCIYNPEWCIRETAVSELMNYKYFGEIFKREGEEANEFIEHFKLDITAQGINKEEINELLGDDEVAAPAGHIADLRKLLKEKLNRPEVQQWDTYINDPASDGKLTEPYIEVLISYYIKLLDIFFKKSDIDEQAYKNLRRNHERKIDMGCIFGFFSALMKQAAIKKNLPQQFTFLKKIQQGGAEHIKKYFKALILKSTNKVTNQSLLTYNIISIHKPQRAIFTTTGGASDGLHNNLFSESMKEVFKNHMYSLRLIKYISELEGLAAKEEAAAAPAEKEAAVAPAEEVAAAGEAEEVAAGEAEGGAAGEAEEPVIVNRVLDMAEVVNEISNHLGGAAASAAEESTTANKLAYAKKLLGKLKTGSEFDLDDWVNFNKIAIDMTEAEEEGEEEEEKKREEGEAEVAAVAAEKEEVEAVVEEVEAAAEEEAPVDAGAAEKVTESEVAEAPAAEVEAEAVVEAEEEGEEEEEEKVKEEVGMRGDASKSSMYSVELKYLRVKQEAKEQCADEEDFLDKLEEIFADTEARRGQINVHYKTLAPNITLKELIGLYLTLGIEHHIENKKNYNDELQFSYADTGRTPARLANTNLAKVNYTYSGVVEYTILDKPINFSCMKNNYYLVRTNKGFRKSSEIYLKEIKDRITLLKLIKQNMYRELDKKYTYQLFTAATGALGARQKRMYVPKGAPRGISYIFQKEQETDTETFIKISKASELPHVKQGATVGDSSKCNAVVEILLLSSRELDVKPDEIFKFIEFQNILITKFNERYDLSGALEKFESTKIATIEKRNSMPLENNSFGANNKAFAGDLLKILINENVNNLTYNLTENNILHEPHIYWPPHQRHIFKDIISKISEPTVKAATYKALIEADFTGNSGTENESELKDIFKSHSSIDSNADWLGKDIISHNAYMHAKDPRSGNYDYNGRKSYRAPHKKNLPYFLNTKRAESTCPSSHPKFCNPVLDSSLFKWRKGLTVFSKFPARNKCITEKDYDSDGCNKTKIDWNSSVGGSTATTYNHGDPYATMEGEYYENRVKEGKIPYRPGLPAGQSRLGKSVIQDDSDTGIFRSRIRIAEKHANIGAYPFKEGGDENDKKLAEEGLQLQKQGKIRDCLMGTGGPTVAVAKLRGWDADKFLTEYDEGIKADADACFLNWGSIADTKMRQKMYYNLRFGSLSEKYVAKRLRKEANTWKKTQVIKFQSKTHIPYPWVEKTSEEDEINNYYVNDISKRMIYQKPELGTRGYNIYSLDETKTHPGRVLSFSEKFDRKGLLIESKVPQDYQIIMQGKIPYTSSIKKKLNTTVRHTLDILDIGTHHSRTFNPYEESGGVLKKFLRRPATNNVNKLLDWAKRDKPDVSTGTAVDSSGGEHVKYFIAKRRPKDDQSYTYSGRSWHRQHLIGSRVYCLFLLGSNLKISEELKNIFSIKDVFNGGLLRDGRLANSVKFLIQPPVNIKWRTCKKLTLSPLDNKIIDNFNDIVVSVEQYFYLDGDGTMKGPFSVQKMREWHQDNAQFNLDVMVRRGNDGSFAPLSEFSELALQCTEEWQHGVNPIRAQQRPPREPASEVAALAAEDAAAAPATAQEAATAAAPDQEEESEAAEGAATKAVTAASSFPSPPPPSLAPAAKAATGIVKKNRAGKKKIGAIYNSARRRRSSNTYCEIKGALWSIQCMAN